MAITPLNEFKSLALKVEDNYTLVYETPVSVSTIILVAQAANRSASERTFTAYFRKDGQDYFICPDLVVPSNDTLIFIEGKFVLEEGEQLYVKSDADFALELTMSVLETSA